MFPQLTAAIADIAAFMDDDEGPDFDRTIESRP